MSPGTGLNSPGMMPLPAPSQSSAISSPLPTSQASRAYSALPVFSLEAMMAISASCESSGPKDKAPLRLRKYRLSPRQLVVNMEVEAIISTAQKPSAPPEADSAMKCEAYSGADRGDVFRFAAAEGHAHIMPDLVAAPVAQIIDAFAIGRDRASRRRRPDHRSAASIRPFRCSRRRAGRRRSLLLATRPRDGFWAARLDQAMVGRAEALLPGASAERSRGVQHGSMPFASS